MPIVADIVDELDDIAPPELADEDDKIGLQTGDMSREVKKIYVCLDVTPTVIEASAGKGADMIVAHHPLIYSPLRSLTETDPIASRAIALIRANISLYVLHTNYDSVPGGMNDVLAEMLEIETHSTPLTVRRSDHFYKIVVFVPEEAVEAVRNAMAGAGAGQIGQYTHCSFRVLGTGSFVPMPAAHPYIGSPGRLEEVEEYRLEMVCAGSWLDNVIEEMMDKHPYDEVAYDIYQLANEPIEYGYGRVGMLKQEMALGEFAEFVRSALEIDYVKVAGDKKQQVAKVALCTGSGSGLWRDAAKTGADVYITGDTKHHDIIDANSVGLSIIDAGHFGTERPGVIVLAERLKQAFAGKDVEVEYIE